MLKKTGILFLGTTILLLTLTACDQGRVINEEERRKVLAGDGSEKVTFADTLQILAQGVSPQSESRFLVYNSATNFYELISISSLMVLDKDRNPMVSSKEAAFEINCDNQDADNQKCLRWSKTFNMNQLFRTSPSVEMNLILSPFRKYQLSREIDGVLQPVARYETYLMQLNWSGHSLRYYLVKQKFLIQADLLPELTSGLTSNNNNDINGESLPPFADLLVYARPYFPSPSTELIFAGFETLSSSNTQLKMRGLFGNILEERPEQFTYVLDLQ